MTLEDEEHQDYNCVIQQEQDIYQQIHEEAFIQLCMKITENWNIDPPEPHENDEELYQERYIQSSTEKEFIDTNNEFDDYL